MILINIHLSFIMKDYIGSCILFLKNYNVKIQQLIFRWLKETAKVIKLMHLTKQTHFIEFTKQKKILSSAQYSVRSVNLTVVWPRVTVSNSQCFHKLFYLYNMTSCYSCVHIFRCWKSVCASLFRWVRLLELYGAILRPEVILTLSVYNETSCLTVICVNKNS